MAMSFEEQLSMVLACLPLIAAGAKQSDLVSKFPCSEATLSRCLLKYKAGGPEALKPKSGNSGRKPIVELSEEEVAALHKRMKLPAMTKSMAIRDLAKDPLCSTALRSHIMECIATGKQFSTKLMQAANVTFQAQEKAKGPKHALYAKESRIRNGMERMPDGSERMIEHGDWWEFDDMSENHPFWYEVAPGAPSRAGRAEKALKKHSALTGRQGLYAMDVKGKLLGLELIGRSNDAYTAADVLRFMRKLFTVYGKPRRGVRLEQAIWKSNVITGNFAMSDEEKGKLKLGLNAIGLIVEYCHFSGTKGGIEGSFDYLQKMASLACVPLGYPDVGRHAGNVERSEKKLRQAHQGVKHPKDLGFPHITELASVLGNLMEERNREWHNGRIQQGVPDMEWMNSMKAAPLEALTRDDERVFMPYVSPMLTLQQEVVTHKVDGEEFRFNTSPLLGMGFGKGAKVRVQFDPTDPSAGAFLYNATSRALCPPNIQPGACLGWVKEQEVTPQFGGKYAKKTQARRYKAYQSVFVSSGSLELRRTSDHEARDGRGNVAKIETEGKINGFRDSENENVTVPSVGRMAKSGSSRRNLAVEAADKPFTTKNRAGYSDPLMEDLMDELAAEPQKVAHSQWSFGEVEADDY